MKLCLLLLSLFSFTVCYCQQAEDVQHKMNELLLKRQLEEKIEKENPSIIQKHDEAIQKNLEAQLQKKREEKMVKENERSMPIIKPKLTAKYLGSNGKGADIYAMMPYNMPCLVPDSSFKSKMPIALKDKGKTPIVTFSH